MTAKISSNLVADAPRLPIGNAVAAIILVAGERYLLQLRDDLASIWYPSCWGHFGGGVDGGEDELAALRRELREELEFEMRDASFFARFDYDLGGIGLSRYYRSYYTVTMSEAEYGRLVLHEGAELGTFGGNDALALPLSPYDAFALFLHFQRQRIGPAV